MDKDDILKCSQTPDCIQPQRSGPLEIKAGGLDEVEIVCARKTTCEYDPICRAWCLDRSDFVVHFPPDETYEGDITMINAVYPRPEGVDLSYVYCSTYNSFLSYAIDWANSGKLSSAQSCTCCFGLSHSARKCTLHSDDASLCHLGDACSQTFLLMSWVDRLVIEMMPLLAFSKADRWIA
ncbi:unnamed protein product [Mesocestoides corti]|uniref:Uncharacterized protein n=1 Tax=Mesocestoides corti TaxID=53468 RepID=A0A0R3UQI1_MESCO|nr:unnamed protein product [Mesocestoides corti]